MLCCLKKDHACQSFVLPSSIIIDEGRKNEQIIHYFLYVVVPSCVGIVSIHVLVLESVYATFYCTKKIV